MVDFLFASSYGSDVISRYWLKSTFSEGVGQFKRKFQVEGTSPTNLCCYQKTRMITLSCGLKNIGSMFYSFVTKHACYRQTDGENYDSQDRTSIVVSRSKKLMEITKSKNRFETYNNR